MISQKIFCTIVCTIITLFQTCNPHAATIDAQENYAEIIFTAEPIPSHVLATMLGKSLPNDMGWPVHPDNLRYLTMSHWGYDGVVHVGHMVVHEAVAQEVLEIFKELFDNQFPIERMQLIDEYDANDDLSMEANNSSAFCCRYITDKPGTYSNHSYGLAVDVNPDTNPYIRWNPSQNKWVVYPKTGRRFVNLSDDGTSFPDRTESYQGIIVKESLCYIAFKKRGWDWGGDWKNYKDYQHFAKDPKDIGL